MSWPIGKFQNKKEKVLWIVGTSPKCLQRTWRQTFVTRDQRCLVHSGQKDLTQWDRVTHICVSKLTIIGSDNGLSPGRRQAILWNKGGILLIGPLDTNFSKILIEIHIFSFKKIHFKMSSPKWWPFCLGLNVLTHSGRNQMAEFS